MTTCKHVDYWRTIDQCDSCDRLHFHCTHCGDQLDACEIDVDGLLGMPDVAAYDVLEMLSNR